MIIEIHYGLLLDSLINTSQLLYQITEGEGTKSIFMLIIQIISIGVQICLLKYPKQIILSILMVINYGCLVESNIPNKLLFSPFYFAYLLTQLKGLSNYLLIPQLIIVGLYSLLRNTNTINREDIWTITHFIVLYVFFILGLSSIRSGNLLKQFQTMSQKVVLLEQMSERVLNSNRWQEINRDEHFIDQVAKAQCFNELREGVILFEQGFDKPATFSNTAAKNIFQFQENKEITDILANYQKLNQTEEVKKSLYTFKSIVSEKQCNSIRQQSQSISQNSKNFSSRQRESSKSTDSSFYHILDRIWATKQKERYVYYIKQPQQLNCIIEVIVYISCFNRNAMTLICRDLSYKKYIKKLELNNQSQAKMISFVSHEFRTPLGCIITMLEFISQNQVNSYVQSSIDNAKYLLNLCNDLLDLAQMKANKFEIRNQNFDLKKLCEECSQMFKLQAEKKGLHLVVNFQENCPTWICSDQNRIKQIIVNLIGNAFKFTISGSITIDIAYFMGNQLQISVIDTGLGIQIEDQGKLLKAFGKVNSEESRKLNSQGVGLGLVISNKIAQQLGDGLKFESTYREGSTFYFTINHGEDFPTSMKQDNNMQVPFVVEEVEQSMEVSQFKEEEQTAICNLCTQILVVDDNQFNIDVFAMFLGQLSQGKLQYDYCVNGWQAVERIQTRPPCQCCKKRNYKVIFMDLEMPGISGFEAAQKIQLISKEHAIIVACSGYTKQSQEEECKLNGIQYYMEKPIKLIELKTILKEIHII